MNDLPLHFVAHHLRLSESLTNFVRRKITPVKRFAKDALGAEIVLRRHNGARRRFSISARLALPGRDVHTRVVHADLYTAIGQLFVKLARRLRKRKTQRNRARQIPAAT